MAKDIKAGGAYVELLLKSQSFVAGLRSASSRLKAFGDSAKRIGSMGLLGGGGGGIGRLFAGAGAAAALAYPIKLAANFEVAQAQFIVFTGSAEKANAMLSRLEKFAAKSLLPVEELQRATQLLLSYEVAADEAVPTIEALAALSRGSAERFQLLALATGQVVGKTRLFAAEVRQLSESGFNPLKTIMEQSGESYEQVQKRLAAGGISAKEFMAALQAATGPTGQFGQLLDAVGKTASGSFSKLLTGIKLAIRPLGQELLPAIKGVLNVANEWTPAFAKIVKENAGFAASVGTVAAAVVGGGAAIISFGIAAKVAAFGLAGVAGAISLLLNPITALTGLLAGAAYWFATSTEWGRTMVTSLAKWFGQLKDIATQAFGGIADALAAGDLALAGRIAMLGLKAAWLSETNSLRQVWNDFKDIFMRTTLEVTFAAERAWINLIANLRSAWGGFSRWFQDAWDVIVHSLAGIGETDAVKAQLDKALQDKVFAREQQGKSDNAAIEAERDAALARVAAAQKAANAAQDAAANANRDATDRELAKAKAELAKAREDAAKARAGVGGLNGIGAAPKFNPANFEMDAGKMKSQIFGSFSGAALAAQGGAGGNVQTKILDEIKAGNKAQEKLGAKQLAAIKEAGAIGP